MKVGRPPLFNSQEELQQKIDEYFAEGMTVKNVVVGKAPNQTVIQIPVPTITGLALYLGFESRQSFYDYENIPEFSYTIKRARTLIEKEYEEALHTASSPAGAIFALKNLGWKDKSEVENSGSMTINWHEEKTYEAFDQTNSSD